MSEKDNKQPTLEPSQGTAIVAEGDYGIKGVIILQILELLQDRLPIKLTGVALDIENLLATVRPIKIQGEPGAEAPVAPGAAPVTPPAPTTGAAPVVEPGGAS